MLLLSLIIFSIIIGWLRGGEIARFQHINLKRLWILLIALGIQIFIILFGASGNSFALDYIKELYIVSYVLLALYLLLNIANRHLIMVLIGVLSNVIAFVFNGGKMPISVAGLKLAGLNDIAKLVEDDKLSLFTQLTENTKYGILTKVIAVGKPFPFTQVLTIGDIIIGLGLFIFIQSVMLGLVNERRSGLSFR